MKETGGFVCKHCNESISSIEMATSHECLKDKEIYMENNNVLFGNDLNIDDEHNDDQKTVHTTIENSKQSTKQNAVWTDNAIMALLSLYEANMHMLDHPKKKSKIWTAISDGLKDFEIEMSTDQVRWKMNILQKKYKECYDNNNKSGRSKMEFKWYDQMDEIFGKNKNAIAAHTVSSQIIKKQVSVLSGQKDVVCTTSKSSPSAELCISSSPSASTSAVSSPSASTSAVSSPSASPLMNKNTRVRPRHGTGSNLAQKKLNIEQQWLKFLEQKEQRDTDRDVRHAKSEERATENLSLKKQMVSLKRKQLEQKKELLTKKFKEKENRHAEMMKIEETKCKLLKKLLFNANVKNIFDDSDE